MDGVLSAAILPALAIFWIRFSTPSFGPGWTVGGVAVSGDCVDVVAVGVVGVTGVVGVSEGGVGAGAGVSGLGVVVGVVWAGLSGVGVGAG